MKIIDPHLHLFDLNKGNYQWLRSENPPFWPDKHLIAKNFSEHELTLTAPLTLAGFVHIEAGFDNQQPWREIAWLENTCNMEFRSIALLDITLPKTMFLQQLEKLMQYKSVVGIRYILDDDTLAILNDKNSQYNLVTLAEHKLSFELQMPLANSQAVDRLMVILSVTPSLMLCINHAGWPTQDNAQYALWLQNLNRLAKFDNVFIKCSGYEMAARDYSINWQHKIINQCLESFGVARVMLASNFPLSLWHASYQDTWLSNSGLANKGLADNGFADNKLSYSDEQLQQLCFSNAQQFYKF
jgi:predicted TIM-barrel fold metal-dependent hydrolase